MKFHRHFQMVASFGGHNFRNLTCLHKQLRTMSQSIYDFTAVNLKGEEVSLSKYKGKVVLIENVASL